MTDELINATVTTIDDEPVSLSYLEEGGPGVYSPDCPLSCGARVWIETDSNVEVVE